jgi:hypothetical protein
MPWPRPRIYKASLHGAVLHMHVRVSRCATRLATTPHVLRIATARYALHAALEANPMTFCYTRSVRNSHAMLARGEGIADRSSCRPDTYGQPSSPTSVLFWTHRGPPRLDQALGVQAKAQTVRASRKRHHNSALRILVSIATTFAFTYLPAQPKLLHATSSIRPTSIEESMPVQYASSLFFH